MGYSYKESERLYTVPELLSKLRWTTADWAHQAAELIESKSKGKYTFANRMNTNSNTVFNHMERLRMFICEEYYIPEEVFFANKKSDSHLSNARATFVYISNRYLKASPSDIGRFLRFGYKTITHHIDSIKKTEYRKIYCDRLWLKFKD